MHFATILGQFVAIAYRKFMPGSAVPYFYLYGEPPRAVDQTFVHLERLDDRSRPSEWTIRPHSHTDLHQIFLLQSGGGDVVIEGVHNHVPAPALITIPATAVHGFDWSEDSAGWVLTVSVAFYEHLVRDHADLALLFGQSHLLALDAPAHREAASWATDLIKELGWSATGHRAAVEASVLRFAILCARLAEADRGKHVGIAASPSAALVARYRGRVEDRFRKREPITVHATALATSQSVLRSACQKIAGRSPSQILDDRALLEAKRLLLYSHMSIAEIAYSLGFTDPAYFSRFFSRQEGCAPSGFRQSRRHA
ncbi:helix-turn-helix domain-containing protein [Aurantiacibacter zhengii]|nr:helix-turn-helix domain-containing protein [Aurantiacibacter zhengii]